MGEGATVRMYNRKFSRGEREIYESLLTPVLFDAFKGDIEAYARDKGMDIMAVTKCFGNPHFCSMFFSHSASQMMMAVPKVLYSLSMKAGEGDPEAQRLYFKVMANMKQELEKTWAAEAAESGDLPSLADGIANLPSADQQALFRLVDEANSKKGITTAESRGKDVAE